jgi:hypothetical protein
MCELHAIFVRMQRQKFTTSQQQLPVKRTLTLREDVVCDGVNASDMDDINATRAMILDVNNMISLLSNK